MTSAPAWIPVRYTAPLADRYPSEWDRWEPLFLEVWRQAYGFTLADFQRDLLRRILETYPEGHARAGQLRYRTVVVSMGRQNGKSDITAILSLWGLLRRPGSETVGIASTVDQASIVYNRARSAIAANPALAAMFVRSTATRGLQTNRGSSYAIKAAKSAALQGIPVHTGIVDELHLVKPALWADLVNGTGARGDTLIVGITTAGDDDSTLLSSLYGTAERAIDGEDGLERFGAFIWESPIDSIPDDDAELLAALIPANPLLASGLLDAEAFVSDVRSGGDGGHVGAVRYRLNRFVKGSGNPWMDRPGMWEACARADVPTHSARPTFFLDVTPSGEFATIAQAALAPDGTTHTEIAATLLKPSTAEMVDALVRLRRHRPLRLGVDSWNRPVIAELKARGIEHEVLHPGDWTAASTVAYQRIQARTLRHGGEGVLAVQVPATSRKAVGEGYRIARGKASVPIDSVRATVGAVYLAETTGGGSRIGIVID